MAHILVCNDKGGVGKSLVAHLLSIILLDRGERFGLIECEKMPRLQKIFGMLVEFFPIEKNKVSAIYENPDVLFTYWDDIADRLGDGTRRIIDMGAGVTFPFCRWVQASGEAVLDDGQGLTCCIVTTAEEESWQSAKSNLEVLRELLPKAEFIVVYNERDGAFYSRRFDGVAGVTLKSVRVPAWPWLQNAGRFDLLAQRTGREVAEACDLPLGTAARSMYAFTDWLLESTDALSPVLGRHPRLALT